jgi:hypothetical protein
MASGGPREIICTVLPVSIVLWRPPVPTRVLNYETSLPMSADSRLGAYLRRRRERSGLSVRAVSGRSRIVPRLVDALEADRPDLAPDRAHCDDESDGRALPAPRAPRQVVRAATAGEPRP